MKMCVTFHTSRRDAGERSGSLRRSRMLEDLRGGLVILVHACRPAAFVHSRDIHTLAPAGKGAYTRRLWPVMVRSAAAAYCICLGGSRSRVGDTDGSWLRTAVAKTFPR